ncbi:MAG: LysR family transcriptional regulator [Lachnospiraceae bacterium]|nr:LysR family transcriptional regulator [Lachnospiraceae bacterium]
MDLREQKYVCALADCGNLTKAAEKLYISQPALSIYITNLEKNMGIPLFERRGKKFLLTYAGERYVERARKMLELEREFNDELIDLIRERAGRIRLGVSQRRGAWFLPPVLVRYEEKWPGIEVILKEGNLAITQEMLKNNELDIVILNEKDVTENMESRLLFSEEFLLAVPEVHPLNEKAEYVPGERYRKLNPEHLDGQTLVLTTSWQSSRQMADVILKENGVTPERIRTVRSVETCLQLIAEGLGVGFIRESFAVNMKYRKRVHYYIVDTEQHKQNVVVAYKKGAKLPGYMEDMLLLLEERGKEFLL